METKPAGPVSVDKSVRGTRTSRARRETDGRYTPGSNRGVEGHEPAPAGFNWVIRTEAVQIYD